MKQIVNHPPEKSTGRKYWRSLGELAETPEFREQLAREFPAGAAELEMDGVSRRNFVKLMGGQPPTTGAVRKWIERGSVPTEWFAQLLMLLEDSLAFRHQQLRHHLLVLL